MHRTHLIAAALATLAALPASRAVAQTTQPVEVRGQSVTVTVGDEAREAAARARAEADEARQRAEEIRARVMRDVEGRMRVEFNRADAVPGWVQGNGDNVIVFGPAGQQQKEKAAFLGVTTSPVPASLRKQVDLPRGIGLVVEQVEENSPAAAAGLEQYDVISKINDQWLVNSQQFGVLVRMNKPGDEVAITVLRQGKPQVLKAKLVEKELPVLGEAEFQRIPGFAGQGVARLAPVPLNLDRDVPALFQHIGQAGNAQININDGEHTLKITVKDGKRTLLASDKDGTVIYDGPVDTEEQIAALPESIREKLKKVEIFQVAVPPGAPVPPAPPAPAAKPAGPGGL
jgi:hypothetical protein